MNRSGSAIPGYDLYGETSPAARPGVVHIEDIAARGRRHDWLIKPHRHGRLLQLICLRRGWAVARLDDSEHRLAGHGAICIPVGTVHGFRFAPETEGAVLTLEDSILRDPGGGRVAEFERLFDAPRVLGFEPQSVHFEQLCRYLALLAGEFERHETGREPLLEWLARAVLMTLFRHWEHRDNAGRADAAGHGRLLRRFRALVDENFRRHWRVEDYAAALHVSTATLNRRCGAILGRSARALANERLLTEIRRRLIYTREPLAGIAFALGFRDPSYFSRYFKRHEGLAPREYRRRKYRETGTVDS